MPDASSRLPKRMRPALGRCMPLAARKIDALAGAVRAQQHHQLAGLGVQRDAVSARKLP
jgi:hypothetical protein